MFKVDIPLAPGRSIGFSVRLRAPSGRTPRVAVVDYKIGNIHSVHNALHLLGARTTEVVSAQGLEQADAIILPGVGAFPEAMRNLRAQGLEEPLTRAVMEQGKPVLGICLGMQLFAQSSDEFGYSRGLGWIDGHVAALPQGVCLPHMGWSVPEFREFAMAKGVPHDAHFYFAHTYHMQTPEEVVAARCVHGQSFVAAVRRGNIWGTQFHPEKSQVYGLMLLRNFLDFALPPEDA
ncbi:imidazole glycerol phosphate synthase subunit HisH [Desulfocurvus sp. DL9XJH121]